MTQEKGVFNSISGVYSGALHAGISKVKEKLDLTFISIPNCFSSAGVFTKNEFAAPCIHFARKQFQKGTIKAVIVNSGIANAATGEQGYQNAELTASTAARLLGYKTTEVAVASTGVIGVQLPMEKISAGLAKLLANAKSREAKGFTRAIMTTDLIPKEILLQRKIGGVTVKLAGVSKGSGMIAPNMATMLGFLVTDARIPKALLRKFLRESVEDSFNMLSVDTDMSTNDLVLAFSTGEKELNLKSKKVQEELLQLFKDGCVKLTKLIARDGEGAKKLLEIKVSGGKNTNQARLVAKSIVDSPLVKTAIHGADPNWGRVAAAVGKVFGVKAGLVDISFAGVKVMNAGSPIPFNRESLRTKLQKETVYVDVNLHNGSGTAIAWGCDLTKGYIDINVAYT